MSRKRTLRPNSSEAACPTSIYFDDIQTVNLPECLVVESHDGRYFVQHPIFHKTGHSEKWPERTNIACFHDTEQFDCIPVFVPVSYDEERNTVIPFGVFCSAACAKAYLIERQAYKQSKMMMFLNTLMRNVFGVFEPIVAAPPQSALAKFGGMYDLKTFRTVCQQYRVVLHLPQIITHAMVFEERPINVSTGEDLFPQSAAPISVLITKDGQRWDVRGLRKPPPPGEAEKTGKAEKEEVVADTPDEKIQQDTPDEKMQQYSSKSLYREFLEEEQTLANPPIPPPEPQPTTVAASEVSQSTQSTKAKPPKTGRKRTAKVLFDNTAKSTAKKQEEPAVKKRRPKTDIERLFT